MYSPFQYVQHLYEYTLQVQSVRKTMHLISFAERISYMIPLTEQPIDS